LLKLNVIIIIFILIIYIVGIHEKINQKIAAKILQKSNIKSKELEEKVKREIRFSKYFRHPNIIHLYEVIETQNDIIMIMEYASGGELFDLICREQVRNYKIIFYYLIYFYSYLNLKHVDCSNK